MAPFESQDLTVLTSVLDDICFALQNERGEAVTGPFREALGRRIFELHANGITDPDQLRLAIMADQLWTCNPQAA